MQVRNQRTLDTVFCNLYADELYHHGVEGMSWGDRNGPPYPLGGVDKKVARAEYKAKKEKERKLKKMQRAAKKARKIKAKNAKQEAEILKKKQKLVKEGDLDEIRKNANLFTNEELQYVIERDAQKRALGSKQERTADEKFELAMKRMAQIGSIAADAGKVLSAAKVGADIVTAVKTQKVKDLEAEDKRLSAIKTEFEMRFSENDRQSAEAQRFLNAAIRNEQYKQSSASKKIAKETQKEQNKLREQAITDSKREREAAEKAYKEAHPGALKKIANKITDAERKEEREAKKQAERVAEAERKLEKKEMKREEAAKEKAAKDEEKAFRKAAEEKYKIDKKLKEVKEREEEKLKKYTEDMSKDQRKAAEKLLEKRMKNAEALARMDQRAIDESVKEFAKGLKTSTGQKTFFSERAEAARENAWKEYADNKKLMYEAKQKFEDATDGVSGTPYRSISSSTYSGYTNSGSDWVSSFLSSGLSPSTYSTQKGWQVTPRRKF